MVLKSLNEHGIVTNSAECVFGILSLFGCVDILHDFLSSSNDSTNSYSEAIAAFTIVKEALATAILMSHPKSEAPTNIITDNSHIAVKAVQQQTGDQWCPIAYFSRELKQVET